MNPLKGKAFEYGHSPLISSCHLCRGRNSRRCTLVSCPCQLFCLCRQIKPFLFLLPLSHCQFLISLNLLWDQRKGSLDGRSAAEPAQQWKTSRVAQLACAQCPFFQSWGQNTWPCHRCTKLRGDLVLEGGSAPPFSLGGGALLKPSAANQGFNENYTDLTNYTFWLRGKKLCVNHY